MPETAELSVRFLEALLHNPHECATKNPDQLVELAFSLADAFMLRATDPPQVP